MSFVGFRANGVFPSSPAETETSNISAHLVVESCRSGKIVSFPPRTKYTIMAGQQRSDGQGNNAFDLNIAASEFSTSLIKDKIQRMSHELDDDLGRHYVLQIRTILREVDRKRIKFNNTKHHLLQNLRGTLSSLGVSNDSIATTVSEIDAMAPIWLAVIPNASSLAVRPPSPAVSPLQETPVSFQGTPPGLIIEPGRPAGAANSESRPHIPAVDGDYAASGNRGSPILEVMDKLRSPMNLQSPVDHSKRPREEDENDSVARKKSKQDGSQEQPQRIFPTDWSQERTLSLADLDPTECVFRHSQHGGFFVIRCDYHECSLGIADSPPFENKRAFHHFNSKHLRECQSDSYIFVNYAYQVNASEDEIASRYQDGKIPECTPSNEISKPTPVKQESPRVMCSQPLMEQEIMSTETPSKGDGVTGLEESDHENRNAEEDYDDEDNKSDDKGPHRNLRQKPRTSYLDMIRGHNRLSMSYGTPEATSARASPQKGGSADRGSDKAKGKDSKGSPAGIFSGKSKTSGARKPFGFTGEWPRRSAPS
ncbi:uncharacterized protein BCR38DRAFT_440332 [Pseudomassariella vexata]|uniref:Uncharacterized protein n=1 Tax=Pseudomassariella vexata TaxID=1141098 RepID=A0A1Y2DQB0_9PEZI|nr:uncharacterized protein BCR38DRAFT_440332 [Pseudomassariella vexata]ORY61478.1 hypothetical protein BCR38DRAFT_440332 [Pseudomassariella vexata]